MKRKYPPSLKAPKSARPSRIVRLAKLVLNNPQRSLFYATTCAFAATIALNATLFQTGKRVNVHHEVVSAKKSVNAVVSAAVDPVILPPERPFEEATQTTSALGISSASTLHSAPTAEPAPLSTATLTPVPLPVSRPVTAKPVVKAIVEKPVAAKPTLPKTQSASLVHKTGLSTPASAVNTSPLTPQAHIAAAQRALNKLGYGPMKADGVAGNATRQALELFEKDRKMAVTGEVMGKTRRILATQSGIAID
jgi:hypothetical protein